MQYTRIVPRRGVNDEGKGKKHALYRLISEATTEYVWLQDDDIIPPTAVRETDADMLILPLRMEPASGIPSLLERLQMTEYAAIQQLTIETARRGHPVLCSGANLLVRRTRWLESYGDLHPEQPSGDDMFLLESFKRRGLKIAVASDAAYEAVVRPIGSWRAFFRQRMRWAGKAAYYTDRDIRLCGATVVIANLLQLLCPPLLLLKFPVDFFLARKRDASVSLPVAFLLELLYPWYMFLSLVGGMFASRKASPSF